MSRGEGDQESPPMIFKITTKLLESTETSEEQLLQSKCLLEKKQTYYEQLQQYSDEMMKAAAEKKANLSIVNDRASLVDARNTYCRDKGKEICVSCNAACQDINEISATLVECEDKVAEMGKSSEKSHTQYEKKIDDLIKLLDLLTKKRKKKLEDLELQEEALRRENLDLRNENKLYEKEEALLNEESDDNDILELEKELKELESKLSILDEDYANYNEEDKSLDIMSAEVDKKYNESVFADLKMKSEEINNEIQDLIINLDKQTADEQERVNKYKTFEEYDRQLEEELTNTTKFWERLEENQYVGFSKLEQEIGKIKTEIIERNERYGNLTENNTKLAEALKQKENEIREISNIVDQYTNELNDVQNYLKTLETSDNLSRQYDEISGKIDEIYNEKVSLEKDAIEKENCIEKILSEIHKEKERANLELLTLENTNLMELRGLEKLCHDIETTKAKIEAEAKTSEDTIQEMEANKEALKEKTESLAKNQEELDKAVVEIQNNLKICNDKKEEVKKKLASHTAPSPVYTKKSETPAPHARPKSPAPDHVRPKSPAQENAIRPKTPVQEFIRPKTPVTSVNVKKVASPKAKRNWDSDSSVESDVETLTDFLKRKHKRVSKKSA